MFERTVTPADDNGCGWFHLSPARTVRPAHSGTATARMSLKLNLRAQELLKKLIHEHGIDCQLQAAGKYQAAIEPKGIAVLEAYRSGLDKLGHTWSSEDAMQQLMDSAVDNITGFINAQADLPAESTRTA